MTLGTDPTDPPRSNIGSDAGDRLRRVSARVVGGRYHSLGVLGMGSHGVVLSARDRITDEVVAVKLLTVTNRTAMATSRREVASLRGVQVPGVVRLLDEGIDGDTAFLVMERVEGEPFPGRSIPARWSDLADTTRALLEILGRVHAAGVVHQDIKPTNVLVREGVPCLLDFGIAWSGLDDDNDAGRLFGTPAYMAPEQARRGTVTPSTDLYALGTMLFEALTGSLPFVRDRPLEAMMARCFDDAPPLGPRVRGVPAVVIDLIDAMLRRDPDARPRSAREALDRLDDRSSQVLSAADEGAPWDREALRGMIVGTDRIFHVREDAAQVLWDRSRGERKAVREELARWVGLGLARRDGDRVVIDRVAVERLSHPSVELPLPDTATSRERSAMHLRLAESLPVGEVARFAHYLRALHAGGGVAIATVLAEARATARLCLERGRICRGLGTMTEAALAAQRIDDVVAPAVLRDFFATWTELALTDWASAEADRVLYEIARCPGVEMTDIEGLLRARLSLHHSPVRAFDEASRIPAFGALALERWRHEVRVKAARMGPLALEVQVVEALRPWARGTNDPACLAAMARWEAWVHYRSGRYAKAAEAHLVSGTLEVLPAARLEALLSAASATFENWIPERALELAGQARAVASSMRLPYFEARASWIERASLYRLGRLDRPDDELFQCVRKLGIDGLQASVALTEAAIAWRAGETEAGREFAMEAYGIWARMGRRWAPDMARALAIACGSPSLPGETEALAGEALACPVVAAGVQVLGLLAAAKCLPSNVSSAEAERLAETVPRVHWGDCAAVLSVRESLAHIGEYLPIVTPNGGLQQ